ncbi:MAG: beta-N-acetylhexosaminidase [Acidobacteriota bacterium]|nr:beta-N-acetylhexosaminidase [Acidobacteriota bacterium]
MPALMAASSFSAMGAAVSPLFERGYNVLPAPQQVSELRDDFRFSADWGLQLGAGVSARDAAVEALHYELAKRFHLKLTTGAPRLPIRLSIQPGAVAIGEAQDRDRVELAKQAYCIQLSSSRIEIQANAPAGLFYGVETLVQLIKLRQGELWLPEATIVDWPDLQLRQIYWDDAHHLDRMDTLKAAIRQAAFYKINGFALKLEGHFQFASAPEVVEPYALSPAEFQELTNYGLRYFVQLIPYLDGPAHIAFILKHPEFAKLREYPESNYEVCAVNPDSYKLLQGMFQDLIDSNKGVEYVYFSTDEPYYIGLADNPQCQERAGAQGTGSVGKLLAQFTAKIADFLHQRGRKAVFWGEYPLKPEDVSALPAYLINGETNGPEFDAASRARGIRQMIYTASEGEEDLFPDYFALPASRRLHTGRLPTPHIEENFRKISFDPARTRSDLMGALNAGWGDRGLHPETFWLGYVTASASAWRPGSPDAAESRISFYRIFYGANVVNMDRLYQLMSMQAQEWSDSWDTAPSTARKPIFGNSNAVHQPPRPARDQTIPLPKPPSPSEWIAANSRRLQLASEAMIENDELLGLLYENIQRADFNRYNLEVFLSVARLCRQNLEMLAGIEQIARLLDSASKEKDRKRASAALDRALTIAWRIRAERNVSLRDATETWYKSWFPRVAEANGRRFLHEVDDVKDHLPDRTADMSYLVYRELLLPFGEWVEEIGRLRSEAAATRQDKKFDWLDLNTTSSELP